MERGDCGEIRWNEATVERDKMERGDCGERYDGTRRLWREIRWNEATVKRDKMERGDCGER